MINTEKPDEEEVLCIYSDPPEVTVLYTGTTFWIDNAEIIQSAIRDYTNNINKNVLKLQWNMSADKKYHANFIYFIKDPSKEILKIKNTEDNYIKYDIFSIINTSHLSFAFIAQNLNNGKEFFIKNSTVKLKFPSGKFFIIFQENSDEKIELQPGGQSCFTIDLEKLLKESKEFSMEDFNYGLSELIWEIKQPDGQVITRNFYLIKFNGELPDDKDNGYKLDGDLNDPAPFRDKKISILPPAKVERDKSTSAADEKPLPNSKTLKKDNE